MADLRKFLDQAGLATLWGKIKAADALNTAAAAAAQAAADAAQADVDALEEYVGKIPETATAKDVVAYVQEKTAGIATSENLQELTNRVAQTETDIDNIEKDYLKAADKTELEGKITAEAEAARAAEKANADAIKAITDDYLKAADKTELEGKITAVDDAVKLLTDGAGTDEIDSVKELIDYVNNHGAVVTGLQDDIDKNAEDILGLGNRLTPVEEKLATVEQNAEVNIIETVKVNGVALVPDADRAVNVEVPTGALASKDSVAKTDLTAELSAEITGKANTADLGTLASKSAVAETDLETALAEKINAKADSSSLGDLAAKDKVAEADLETELAAKLNGKADTASLGTLAGKNTVEKTDLSQNVQNSLALADSAVQSVEVINKKWENDLEETSSDVFYVDNEPILAIRGLTTNEINAICN